LYVLSSLHFVKLTFERIYDDTAALCARYDRECAVCLEHEARAGETASKDRYPQQLQFSTVSASSSTPEPHQKAPE